MEMYLSMPPIINGDLTRLEPGISKLFVDITGTDDYAVDASAAIIASMLSDVGGEVFQIQISKSNEEPQWVPEMSPRKMQFDLRLSNDILGFDFSEKDAREALEKSRLSLDGKTAIIPRFRSDIIHPIYLAEEVALGYGIWKITPKVVASSLDGTLNSRLKKIDSMIEALVGLGLTEVWNLSLSPKELVQHCGSEALRVDDAKSQSFEFLRCDITASLLQVLGGSSHEEYPQMIFEEAPTFFRSKENSSGVLEEEHVAVLLADSTVRYSAIKSKLDEFLRLVLPREVTVKYETSLGSGEIFAAGRTANVLIVRRGEEIRLGRVGEVGPRP